MWPPIRLSSQGYLTSKYGCQLGFFLNVEDVVGGFLLEEALIVMDDQRRAGGAGGG